MGAAPLPAGANRNDSQDAPAWVDTFPPQGSGHGRPQQRPDSVLGDRGYDRRYWAWATGAAYGAPRWLAMRRTAQGSGLGRWRWAWLVPLPGSVSVAAHIVSGALARIFETIPGLTE